MLNIVYCVIFNQWEFSRKYAEKISHSPVDFRTFNRVISYVSSICPLTSIQLLLSFTFLSAYPMSTSNSFFQVWWFKEHLEKLELLYRRSTTLYTCVHDLSSHKHKKMKEKNRPNFLLECTRVIVIKTDCETVWLTWCGQMFKIDKFKKMSRGAIKHLKRIE